MLCSVALLNLQHPASGGSDGEAEMLFNPGAPNTPPHPPKTLPHLLMVSSSSESQKLVVSSSLLIIVLELS